MSRGKNNNHKYKAELQDSYLSLGRLKIIETCNYFQNDLGFFISGKPTAGADFVSKLNVYTFLAS